MLFNNVEYITIENQTTSFPKHFHKTFCISLIHEGVEQIDFEDNSLFTEAGSISITNPFEIHANPLIDNNTYLKFDTIYIPNEVVKTILGGKSIKFSNRQITSNKVNKLFSGVKDALDTKDDEVIQHHLSKFLELLRSYSEEYKKEYSEIKYQNFNQINDYIESHIYDKFSLETLSKLANINKFGFVKKFKASTGMTPMNYVLMRKIFSSKKLIAKNSELTTIAYQYNFTDMSHYSKTFKRFVGISPLKYQESLA